MSTPQLVLFDLDGTLLDGSGLPAAMRRTCAVVATRTRATADDLVAANTAAWQRLWPEVEDDYLLGGRPGEDIGADVWRATLEAVDADTPSVLALALRTWESEERASFRLFDDVAPALDALDAAGVRVGLLTNGAASVQRRKLEAVGLADRFDPSVISGEIGIRKPDPAVFGVALRRAGLPADRVWYVGDNLWHDVAPAAEAGLHAVWIDRHGVEREPGWPQPDATLPSLAPLPDLVGDAAPGR